ncbi:hypothetical protein [Pedobacter sp. GR22-10]|uniref:hypothetical protein n=1 Tax=Pedobacter sp. GR22-10 TaxID=2994472 RepID=UPI0022468BE6|nr:hypothetical protein [Pedobacter sp. GR22-10]MCX2429989.1 hypothetical protein [Pedobacter sp. GR22-10]
MKFQKYIGGDMLGANLDLSGLIRSKTQSVWINGFKNHTPLKYIIHLVKPSRQLAVKLSNLTNIKWNDGRLRYDSSICHGPVTNLFSTIYF